MREGCHATGWLQRIAGGDHEPDSVEPECAESDLRDMSVPGMRWVEAAAQQADAGSSSVTCNQRVLTLTLEVSAGVKACQGNDCRRRSAALR